MAHYSHFLTSFTNNTFKDETQHEGDTDIQSSLRETFEKMTKQEADEMIKVEHYNSKNYDSKHR